MVAFQGDFTLDYNQEAQFYGVFSSNHGDLAAAYFPPITAFEGHARSLAVLWASTAQVKCPTKTMVYPAHLAPWGAQSFDTTTFGDWNGHFAALLFINHWEYTRNASFATEVAVNDLGLTAALIPWQPVPDVTNCVPKACALLGAHISDVCVWFVTLALMMANVCRNVKRNFGVVGTCCCLKILFCG